MKRIHALYLTGLITLAPSFSAMADTPTAPAPSTDSDSLETLVQYFKNMGAFMGYDLDQDEVSVKPNALLDAPLVQVTQNYLYNSMLGALPVTATSAALSKFVPNALTAYSGINAFANYTFASQPYNSASVQNGKITANPLIDQQSYQNDPVSQAVLNVLTTPDYSYCMNYDGTEWLQDSSACPKLFQYQVIGNVIGGPLPGGSDYFSFDYNQSLVPQLNSNTLLAPLMYSDDASSSTSSSSGSDTPGLTAANQAQSAANFIRYASGAVKPISLPTKKTYDATYAQATAPAKTAADLLTQKKAQAALTSYFTSLRAYAASASVGVGNLYFMLSKRMPQNQSASEQKPTSQAMSEFVMASRRLYNPELSADKQWVAQINQASSDTVQKEIAVLLAEINYQLYLTRQQEERTLLTTSMLLLQSIQIYPDLSQNVQNMTMTQ